MGLLTMNRTDQETGNNQGPRIPIRLIIALVIAAVSIFGYFSHTSYNPVTDQKQHVSISRDQEIALGLQSAPAMEQQYGGDSSNPQKQALVTAVGNEIVTKSDAGKSPYQYKFHLLSDSQTVNAFALPGGQVFITQGLLKFLKTRGQLACVLGHEIGHVVARHSAQHLAKQELSQGLTGAAVLATYDPNDPRSRGSAEMAMLVAQMVNLKFNRNDELEADKLGVRFSSAAGYDPRSMIDVMEILQREANSRTPEFFSTHPDPEHRIARIKEAIAERFPNGVPDGLIK